MIERALFRYLSTIADLTVLVDDRIHPLVIPQRVGAQTNRVPAVVYSINGVQRGVSYCGTDRLVRTTFTIDCYAARYDGARQVADAVRAALLDFRGPMGDNTLTVPVSSANIDSEFDLLDIEPGLYRVSQTWQVWHQE